MNYDEELQGEINELETDINHQPRLRYWVFERNETEEFEIKRAILLCLARMTADRENEQRANLI